MQSTTTHPAKAFDEASADGSAVRVLGISCSTLQRVEYIHMLAMEHASGIQRLVGAATVSSMCHVIDKAPLLVSRAWEGWFYANPPHVRGLHLGLCAASTSACGGSCDHRHTSALHRLQPQSPPPLYCI